MSSNEKPKVDLQKLALVVDELEKMGYEYVKGFVSNKKDKVTAIHRQCGRERITKFSLYDKKECRYCKRQKTKSKYQKSITKQIKQEILKLHKNGFTNLEIGNEIGFSNSAVRKFLNSLGLNSNKKTKKPLECKNCGKKFVSKYVSKAKSCSKKCMSELISKSKIKYTKKDIESIKHYKKRNFTNNDISNITGANLNKIKEVVKENNLYLTFEQAQKNAYDKKLKKNPDCMEKMREIRMTCTTNDYNNKMSEIIDILEKPENILPNAYIAEKFGITPKSLAQGLRTRGREDLIQPSKTSAAEEEIADFIEKITNKNIDIKRSNRSIVSPKELDIYIPSLNLAIEYCGLYWHNEDSPEPRDKSYHYEKMKKCNEKDVRLITIFEDEWKEREKQVKNYLKSVVGFAKKRVYARKCEVRIVGNSVAKVFLEENHIQGKTTMKIAFGLYFENELLGLVTGNCHHRQKRDNAPFVLNRLVFKDEVQVVGGASKLLKRLIKYAKHEGYKELISWSDNRWSEGNVYKKTGFNLVAELKPDYSYYVGNGKRESKQSNKKANLLKKGAKGTLENTEKELAKSLNLCRIWDCGKKRWAIYL